MASSYAPAQSHYVEVNGQTLHYKQWSQNGPPLLFLHGVTSSGSSWDIISPQFMSRYRVMAFDLRGHGLSSKPASGYTWAEDYAADLVEFINTHLDEPAIVVGHSLGAAITVPIAASTPGKVRAVVMEDPPLFADERPAHIHNRFKPVLTLKQMPYELRVERFMDIMGVDRDAATRRASDLEAVSEQALLELMEGQSSYRVEYWLPMMSCPSLVILGSPERGGVVARDDRPRLERLLTNTTLIEWGDVGHSIHIEQPERFVSEVKSFLEGLPA